MLGREISSSRNRAVFLLSVLDVYAGRLGTCASGCAPCGLSRFNVFSLMHPRCIWSPWVCVCVWFRLHGVTGVPQQRSDCVVAK